MAQKYLMMPVQCQCKNVFVVKKIEELKDGIEELKSEENKQKWSFGGMALRGRCSFLDDYGVVHDDLWKDNIMCKCRLKEGNIFKNEDCALLERDRKRVLYTMKKMACESREDNDWRFDNENNYYVIHYNSLKGRFFIEKCCEFSYFNYPYFKTIAAAEGCLDHLLTTYGEERLKEIWGWNERAN